MLMKIEKRKIMEGIELPNPEKIRVKENYKYLEILEADTTKQADMREKNDIRVS